MMTGFAIKDVKLDNRLVMAPMAGYTGSAWRVLVRRFGCALSFTELICARGLVYEDKKTLDFLRIDDKERPVAIQLFGDDADIIAAAAKIVEPHADIIDLNFACPAKKVVKNNSGAALLKDIDLAQKIAQKAVASVKCPVTAKIRLGWDDTDTAGRLAMRLADVGVAGVTIHGRTAVQQFRGDADWTIIEELAGALSIPVIGNGDLDDPVDIAARLKTTSCAGLMIGRAALGNPWIFQQVQDCLKTGREPEEIPVSEKMALVIEYAAMVADSIGHDRAVRALRKHLILFFKGMPKASIFRERLVKLEKIEDLESIMRTPFKAEGSDQAVDRRQSTVDLNCISSELTEHQVDSP